MASNSPKLNKEGYIIAWPMVDQVTHETLLLSVVDGQLTLSDLGVVTMVSGRLVDIEGHAVSTWISFQSTSTPLVLNNGVVIASSIIYIHSDSDGVFGVDLQSGNYQVTVYAASKTSQFQFNIAVPNGGAGVTIDQITTSALRYVAATPATSSLVSASVLSDVLNISANFRFQQGQLQLYDMVLQSWRAFGVNNGATVIDVGNRLPPYFPLPVFVSDGQMFVTTDDSDNYAWPFADQETGEIFYLRVKDSQITITDT